ncbi:MAG: hypothetical protein ACYS1A_17640 [Planctomycetota bacterium]
MGYMSTARLMIAGLIVLLAAPHVYAAFVPGELGSLITPPTSIVAYDSNSDGVMDSAVVGSTTKALATGLSSWTVSVSGVGGVAPFDHDENGFMNGIVIAGNDVIAVDSYGTELWKKAGLKGKSAIAADLDEDGHKDEIVVGTWNRIVAFDADGTELWNLTDLAENNVKDLVLTEEYVIGNSRSYLFFISISNSYPTLKQVAQIDNVLKISAIDLEGSGTLNGVVVLKKGSDENFAEINAYSMYGENQEWSGSGKYHETGTDVSAAPIDKFSKGILDHVVFNIVSGAYWVNNKGVITRVGTLYAPSAIAPIDFDGDGILDDTLAVTGSESSAGKTYGYSAYGQELDNYNLSGGVKVVALDMNFDGKANDAIIASSYDLKVYSLISSVTDTTTSSTPVTTTPPPTTTTTPVTTTPAPTTTSAPVTTTPAPAAEGISVSLGDDKTVGEGIETTITATATASTPDGTIVNYLWIEGGTVLGSGNPLTKAFDEGVHEIKVVITDNAGKTAEDTVIITAGEGLTVTADDSDGDGLKNALETQMGTDPNNSDTDGDGILDGKDPNPLVAGANGSIMDSVPDVVITAMKWIVIIGGAIIAIIFIREKVLDVLWERNQDWSE